MNANITPLNPFEQAVEALLFASDVPLRTEEIAGVIAEVTGADLLPAAVDEAVTSINERYAASGHAFHVRGLGGGLRMTSVDEVAPYLQTFFADESEQRLSKSLLETLAVIAYKQPVTKPEVDHIRGVSSDYALRGLLERGIAEIAGRSDSVGRPLLYGTTSAFLDLFNLGSLEDLPAPREIEEILSDPSFHRERSRLLSELAATETHHPAANPVTETGRDDEPTYETESA